MEQFQFRPLGKLKNVIEHLDVDISHTYEDLVFLEHTAYIIRFDDKVYQNLYLHFNEECPDNDAKEIFENFKIQASKEGFHSSLDQKFKLEQVEGKEELRLEFV